MEKVYITHEARANAIDEFVRTENRPSDFHGFLEENYGLARGTDDSTVRPKPYTYYVIDYKKYMMFKLKFT